MAGIPWTPEEKADLLACQSWEDFIGKGWCRTYDSWEKARRMERCRGKLGPAPKPDPQTPPPTDDLDPFEVIEKYVALQRATSRSNRIQRHITVSIPASQPIGIAFLSDMHLGSPGVDYQQLVADVRIIAETEGLYVCVGGDVVDNYVLDKLAHAGRGSPDPFVQWEMARGILRQLAHKIVCVGSGNHDAEWTYRVSGIDPFFAMLRDVPVCYIGEGGVIDLKVGAQAYRVYRKHRGRSSINNALHGAQSLFRLPEVPGVDVVCTEHYHDPAGGWWRHEGRMVVGLRAGSYKIDDQHARTFGHFNSAVGVPVVIFSPHERELYPLPGLRAARSVLSQWWSTTDETA